MGAVASRSEAIVGEAEAAEKRVAVQGRVLVPVGFLDEKMK